MFPTTCVYCWKWVEYKYKDVYVRRVSSENSITVPVKKDRFDKRHHISTSVVTCTYDGHVDGL